VVDRIDRLRRAVVGTAQWMGHRPITEPALPRLALSRWVADVRAQGGAVRRHVLMTAFRNRTWIEWAVYATCQLRRLGVATTLVYSGSEVRRLYPLARVAGVDQLGFWAGVAEIPDLRLVDLDDWRPGAEEAERYRDFAHAYAPTVAAYDLHVEEQEEGPLAPAYRRAVTRAEGMLADTAAALERILQQNPVSRVIVYSGLIGRSPAVQEAARRQGVEVLTVEGWAWRPGHMICNRNAPALEYNVEGWLRAAAWDASRERETQRLLRFQEGALGRDEIAPGNLHRVQRTSVAAPLPPEVAAFRGRPGPSFLLATNVVGDSSTLRRATLFPSQRDWLRQTISFFRHHPDWSLLVRAHPDEAFIRRKVVVRMGDVAREMAGSLPNVLVIGGDQDVSSYALLPGLRGGLVWISSIGADMVARGLPVLAAARPKYHELGIVEEPPSASGYFEALTRLASRPAIAPRAEQQERARQYLDLVFSQFSFDAFSPSYRAHDLLLEGPGSPPDAGVFYRVVAGDLPPETRPRHDTRDVA